MNKLIDMTQGKPLKQIISFSLPILFGSTIDMIYSITDSIVVGRMIGLNAYAAIGATGFPHWAVISIISGLSSGFSSAFSHRFGGKEYEKLKKLLSMSILLSLLIGITLTIISVLLTNNLLSILNTPQDIMSDAEIYLKIRFFSLTVSFLGYIINSLFYAMGNSGVPFAGNIIAIVVNLLLNIFLIKVTDLGIAAVAVATVTAQICSIIFCIFKLRKYTFLRLSRQSIKIDIHILKELLRLSIPLGFRDLPSAVVALIIQYTVNGFGSIYVAGVAAAKQLYVILFSPCGAVSEAIGSFAGQNFGAKNYERIRLGLKTGRRILFVLLLFIIPVMLFAGRLIMSLFIAGDHATVNKILDVGAQQLNIILIFLPSYYFSVFYRAALRGIGASISSFLSGLTETAARVVALLIMPPLLGIWSVYFIEVIGWPFMMIQLLVSFRIIMKQKINQPYNL